MAFVTSSDFLNARVTLSRFWPTFNQSINQMLYFPAVDKFKFRSKLITKVIKKDSRSSHDGYTMAAEGYKIAPEPYTRAIGMTHEFNKSG